MQSGGKLPVGAAAAIACLKATERLAVKVHARDCGAQICAGLRRLKERFDKATMGAIRRAAYETGTMLR